MNSFNKVLFSPLVCLAFACGSTDNGDLFEDEASDGGDQFGSVEQAMSAPTSPTYQYGTRTSTTQQRCDRSAAGQVCSSVTGLTEGAGVVGSYQKHSGCDIYIDRTDILAKGASTADDRRLMRHAVLVARVRWSAR